jgi:uncharacterized membrane protein YraQ (UPF0718 family)
MLLIFVHKRNYIFKGIDMTETSLNVRSWTTDFANQLWTKEKVWLFTASLLAALFAFSPSMGFTTVSFALQNLLNVAPFLALSVGIAAYAGATGADGLIARAFTGSPAVMILIAAAAGGLSPFCSCGVIPLIAALLVMGVPLSAVMAFWLASPVMDPSMFLLTTGTLGFEFAVAKTITALSLGIFGSYGIACGWADGSIERRRWQRRMRWSQGAHRAASCLEVLERRCASCKIFARRDQDHIVSRKVADTGVHFGKFDAGVVAR